VPRSGVKLAFCHHRSVMDFVASHAFTFTCKICPAINLITSWADNSDFDNLFKPAPCTEMLMTAKAMVWWSSRNAWLSVTSSVWTYQQSKDAEMSNDDRSRFSVHFFEMKRWLKHGRKWSQMKWTKQLYKHFNSSPTLSRMQLFKSTFGIPVNIALCQYSDLYSTLRYWYWYSYSYS